MMSSIPNRRKNAWVELNLERLCQNLSVMKTALSPSSEIILVVKANAYGHGITTVASKAFSCGVSWFFVATLDEALSVRAVLPEANILLLGAVWPADIREIVQQRILPVLFSLEQARELAQTARREGLTLPCHMKVDTGMGRLGLFWEGAPGQIAELNRQGGLDIRGLCTHFASAGRSNDLFAKVQAERFQTVLSGCLAHGMSGLYTHLANSAAFSSRPELDMNGVRLGILAYGYGGRGPLARVSTSPLLQWKTRVIQVRPVPADFPVGYLSTYVTPEPTCLATIDAGYADGVSRLMSNKGYVLVGGRRAKVVGRVTMNFTTVDVGAGSGVKPGDEVVLIGTQGGESLWADEVARWCATIPYEILTNIRNEVR
jgi:alanine racemase